MAYINGKKVLSIVKHTTTTPAKEEVETTITAGTSSKTVTPESGKTFSKVIVEPTPSETTTTTPTKYIDQNIYPSAGKLLSKVTVQKIPDEYIVPTGTLSVTDNGVKDVRSYEKVNINVPTGTSNGTPIEVTTASAMDALLVAANNGKVYRYTGTTNSKYTNGKLYIVEEE